MDVYVQGNAWPKFVAFESWQVVVLVVPLLKGLNWEKKFVPVVLFPVPFLGSCCKYKNPKNAANAMMTTIIKSIKFLFDIKIIIYIRANGHPH